MTERWLILPVRYLENLPQDPKTFWIECLNSDLRFLPDSKGKLHSLNQRLNRLETKVFNKFMSYIVLNINTMESTFYFEKIHASFLQFSTHHINHSYVFAHQMSAPVDAAQRPALVQSLLPRWPQTPESKVRLTRHFGSSNRKHIRNRLSNMDMLMNFKLHLITRIVKTVDNSQHYIFFLEWLWCQYYVNDILHWTVD